MYRFLIAILLAVGFGCPAFAQVTNNCTQVINGVTTPVPCGIKVGNLPAAATPTGTDIVPIVQGGNTVGATLNQVKTFVGNGLSPGTVTDTMAALSNKPSAFLASTTNVASLSGLPTIDGVTMTRAGVVLLTGQTTQSQNGPWCVPASGTWARCPWYPTAGTVQAFVDATIQIRAGTAYSGALFKLATPTSGTITIDTTATTWTISPVALGSVAPQASGTIVGCSIQNISACVPTALSRTDIYVTDFGAICNGSLNLLSSLYGTLGAAQVKYPSATSLTQDADAVAINAAITQARTATNGSHVILPPGQVCVVAAGINLTAWATKGNVIEGSGATLIGATTGTAVLDAFNAQYLKIRDLYVYGQQGAAAPSTGIQMGIGVTGTSGGELSLENVFFDGYYTLAAIYNANSETSKFDAVRAWNNQASTTSYAVVEDGIWHFAVTSAFVTVNRTANTAVSFNDDAWIDCDIRQLGTGVPIWLAGTHRHFFGAGTYVLNTGSTIGAILFSNSSGDGNSFLEMNVHFETTNLAYIFQIAGSGNATPLIQGFIYRDHGPQASTAIFNLGSGVTGPVFRDLHLEIGGFQSGGVTVFDTNSAYSGTGYVYVNSSTAWGTVSNFFGVIDQAGTLSYSSQGNATFSGASISARSTVNGSTLPSNGTYSPSSNLGFGSASVAVASFNSAGSLGMNFGNVSTGTQFTVTGCGTIATAQGGATGGLFVAASGATTTCVITIGGASPITAPNGWVCSAWDETTTAAIPQSAHTATTCSIKAGSAIASGDHIVFNATAF